MGHLYHGYVSHNQMVITPVKTYGMILKVLVGTISQNNGGTRVSSSNVFTDTKI